MVRNFINVVEITLENELSKKIDVLKKFKIRCSEKSSRKENIIELESTYNALFELPKGIDHTKM